MVFGWGRVKKPGGVPEAVADPVRRDISMDDIEKILADLADVRAKTLVSQTASLGAKITAQLGEIRGIAVALEQDSLNVDDIDKHLKAIVERGKRQVIATIKEETSEGLADVRTVDDVLALNGAAGRSLRRIGDVLGRQTRVIHLFAKKYAGKLKAILSELKDDKEAMQSLVDNHKALEGGISDIRGSIASIKKLRSTLGQKSKRITVFEESMADLEKKTAQITSDVEMIKKSGEYKEFLRIRQSLEGLDSERRGLRREVNDQFTKISRPLGKYEYVSSMDKDQKNLLHDLVSDPFEAISHDQKTSIITILQYVRKGVVAGSVSVKDAGKSVQFLDETTELLDSLIRQKEEFTGRQKALQDKLAAFDVSRFDGKTAELDKTVANRDDAESKIQQFRADIDEIGRLIPRTVSDIERTLQDISSVMYVIRSENS